MRHTRLRVAPPQPMGRAAPSTPCKRTCCWTPLGHSTVLDHLPPTHPRACHCHRKEI